MPKLKDQLTLLLAEEDSRQLNRLVIRSRLRKGTVARCLLRRGLELVGDQAKTRWPEVQPHLPGLAAGLRANAALLELVAGDAVDDAAATADAVPLAETEPARPAKPPVAGKATGPEIVSLANRVRDELGDGRDRAAEKFLGLSRGALSAYRRGVRTPQPCTVRRLKAALDKGGEEDDADPTQASSGTKQTGKAYGDPW